MCVRELERERERERVRLLRLTSILLNLRLGRLFGGAEGWLFYYEKLKGFCFLSEGNIVDLIFFYIKGNDSLLSNE